jgi:putative endonuclease
MAHVYILYSENLNKYYVGSCLNLKERLQEHILKKFPNCFTSKDNSWILFFEIPNLEYKQSRDIERHIKSMKSSKYIKNLANYPEMLEKLKVKYL